LKQDGDEESSNGFIFMLWIQRHWRKEGFAQVMEQVTRDVLIKTLYENLTNIKLLFSTTLAGLEACNERSLLCGCDSQLLLKQDEVK
jgi:hypothetical protein